VPEPRILLYPETCYHIYNHAVGSDNFFDHDKHYLSFLAKYKQHILPVSDLLAYCLMPNHFHLIVRIKDENTIKKFLDKKQAKSKKHISETLSQLFSNFFNSYSKHYNFAQNRKGTLFKRAFMRKHIDDIGYLRTLICYVHRNPIEAGFTKKPEEWKYSSFKAIMGKQPTLIQRGEVINLFDTVENFKFCHLKPSEIDIAGF